MTEEQKNWIDNASFEQLLSKWRFSPTGSPWFVGETGDYFAAAMKKKRSETRDDGVSASKSIGW